MGVNVEGREEEPKGSTSLYFLSSSHGLRCTIGGRAVRASASVPSRFAWSQEARFVVRIVQRCLISFIVRFIMEVLVFFIARDRLIRQMIFRIFILCNHESTTIIC